MKPRVIDERHRRLVGGDMLHEVLVDFGNKTEWNMVYWGKTPDDRHSCNAWKDTDLPPLMIQSCMCGPKTRLKTDYGADRELARASKDKAEGVLRKEFYEQIGGTGTYRSIAERIADAKALG